MATLQSLDPTTPMFAQLKEETGPIVSYPHIFEQINV